MRDQLDDGAHLHPPHPSHAPIHPVLSVESTKGEHISAILLQVASSSKLFLWGQLDSLVATQQGNRSPPGILLLFLLILSLAWKWRSHNKPAWESREGGGGKKYVLAISFQMLRGLEKEATSAENWLSGWSGKSSSWLEAKEDQSTSDFAGCTYFPMCQNTIPWQSKVDSTGRSATSSLPEDCGLRLW